MKGLLWVLFEKVGLAALSMLVAFWYAILLGPEGFGVASMFLATTLLVTAIQNNMQQNPLLATKVDFSTAMYASIKGWMLISVFTFLALYALMSLYWGDEYLALILVCVCHIPISSLSKVLLSELLRNQEYKTIALRSILGKLLGVVAGVSLAYAGHVKMAILVQSLVDLTIQLVVMATRSSLFSFRKIFTPFKRDERRLFRALFREGIPSGFNVIDGCFKTKGVIVLLGVVVGPYASGVFALAMKLVDVPRTMVGYGLTTWALGKLKAASTDIEKLRTAYVSISYVGVLVLAPAYLGMIAISLPLLNLFFGPEWSEAAYITNWLCVYYLVLALQLFVPPVLVITQNTHKTMKATVFSTCIMVIGSLVLVPILGLYGIIVALFMSALPLFYKQDVETKSLFSLTSLSAIKASAGVLLSAGAMLFVLVNINYQYGIDNMYLLIPIGIAVYGLCLITLYCTGLLNKQKLKSILSM
ncbi:oligosaccharide flippase family protein [Vibrio panuliri]|nr:oligosaccharide flippase family protein [Vibrio panuliri]KAB1457250.1 oligosaccharide flippase family protein [Vibrio panuliri]